MSTVDLQQLGRMAEATERNSKAVEKLGTSLANHATKIERGFEKVHKRIDDHMDKEEMERKEIVGLIHAQGAQIKQLRWQLGLIAAGLGVTGSAVGPVIQKLVASALFNDAAEFVLVFLPW